MRKLTVLLLALMMTACGESAPTETVESLIADPERLAELREQCRDNPAGTRADRNYCIFRPAFCR